MDSINHHYLAEVFGVSFLGFALLLLILFTGYNIWKKVNKHLYPWAKLAKERDIECFELELAEEEAIMTTRVDQLERGKERQAVEEVKGQRRIKNIEGERGKEQKEKMVQEQRTSVVPPSPSILSLQSNSILNYTSIDRIDQPHEIRSDSPCIPIFLLPDLGHCPSPVASKGFSNEIAKNDVNLGHIPKWFSCPYPLQSRRSLASLANNGVFFRRSQVEPYYATLFGEIPPLQKPRRASNHFRTSISTRRDTMEELSRKNSYLRYSRSIIDEK